MAKAVSFQKEKIISGINTVADAVRLTMGARGQTVLIERAFGGPIATKDGATVAKFIELDDPEENIGAQLIKEVSANVAEKAGDGTTCATVLTQALINGGYKAIMSGASPRDIHLGIEDGIKAAVHAVENYARPVTDSEEIKQIATISANGDEEIGNMIADAIKRIGQDGAITVEEAKGTKTEIDVVEGFQFDSGFLSSYFVNDTEKMKYQYRNVNIFLSEKRITNLRALLPILEPVAKDNTPLLIIADDIDSEALATLVLNRVKGGMPICAVKAPLFGNQRKAILHDIAALTGATIISDDMGMSFENVTPDVLGKADSITVDSQHTLIIGGHGDTAKIEERIEHARKESENATGEYERAKAQERISRMTGGVAVIKVGGMTEPEAKEKKDRVDDAVAATRAAIESGIVAGGGVTLLRAAESMCTLYRDDRDYDTGIDIVSKALKAPINQIASNAGLAGVIVRDKILSATDVLYSFGYNVATNEYGDLFGMGVIDPAKVVITALQTASSCALTVLSSGCVITEKPTDEKKKPAPNSLV